MPDAAPSFRLRSLPTGAVHGRRGCDFNCQELP
jgi:hypothetical protein